MSKQYGGKVCPACGATFRRAQNRPKVLWEKQTYCSHKCAMLAIKSGWKERFWEKVDKSQGEDGCWIWTGGKDSGGYGLFTAYGAGFRCAKAHRVSFSLSHGVNLHHHMVVMHSCDNPECVNPKHLLLGTVADNNADKARKGRTRPQYGSSNQRAIMNEQSVIDARNAVASGMSVADVARAAGVPYQAMWNAVHRRTWRHL